MYLKIVKGLKVQLGNRTDYLYGGLDISLITGSCIDEEENTAVVVYGGTTLNESIVEITKEEFDLFCETVKNKTKVIQVSLQDQLNLLKVAIDELIMGGF